MLMLHLSNSVIKKQSKIAYPLQILDLLQLSRRELESKERFRLAMREYDDWCNLPAETTTALFPYARIKGAHLYRQAKGAGALYKFVRRKRKIFFKAYTDALPEINAYKRLAS